MSAELKSDLESVMDALGATARSAAAVLARTDTVGKNEVLRRAAGLMRARQDVLLEANDQDMTAAARKGLSDAMMDRLKLDLPPQAHDRIEDAAHRAR